MTWRWPWVSHPSDAVLESARTLMDLAKKTELAAEREVAIWRNRAEAASHHVSMLQIDVREERARTTDLLTKYHALKLAGAVVVEPPLPAPVVAIAQPDRIKQTIRRQVRANPDMRGLESHLIKYAAELRAQNLPDDKIVDRLSDWESSETMSAPVSSTVAIEGAENAA